MTPPASRSPDPAQRRATAGQTVAARLRDEIRSGALEPGSRLRQVEVARRFAVSTTPVREAFAALEREGMLVSSAQRGVVVFRPSSEDLRELYEIRIPLEALATEKAVPRLDAEDLQALSALLSQMDGTADRHAYQELNRAFHARIYAAAGRPRLQRMIMDLRDTSTAYLRLYINLAPTAADTYREHDAIFEAISARAPKRAATAMTAHLQRTVDHVSEELRRT